MVRLISGGNVMECEMKIFSQLFFGIFGKIDDQEWSITPGDNVIDEALWKKLKQDKRITSLEALGQLRFDHATTRRDLEIFLAPPDKRLIKDLCNKADPIPDHQVFDGQIRVDLADPLRSYDRLVRRQIDRLASDYGSLEQLVKTLTQQAVPAG